ncbi:hypothetical protein F5Y16DRAFT_405027 [Xylariaceae sp. FL0255]|nr:hypothetical protein F5Y16DRAFT_405027 [Xylariaceae sp. FL0255]
MSKRMPTRVPLPQPTPRPPRPTTRGPSVTPSGFKPQPSPRFSFQAKVWTGAFAAVTFVGTIYGAGLKTQQEYKAEKQQIIEATPEERIKVLEDRKAALKLQKRPFEEKIARARVRIAEAARKKAEEEAKDKARAAATQEKS